MVWRTKVRKPNQGDGSALQRFRWWHTFTRSVFSIALGNSNAPLSRYSIEVRQLGDKEDGKVRARLYRDGRLELISAMPAAFPVPGGRIDVAVGTYGFERCHFVTSDGIVHALTPHPKTMEGHRARLHRIHPGLSRIIGAVSTLLVLIGAAVAVPQLVATILQIPPVAEAIGLFELPYTVSTGVNIAAIVAAAVGSTERALRFRTSWLDDLAG